MFGKVMSIPDNLIYSYFELATDISMNRLREIKDALDNNQVNPMELKKELGETIVGMYHSAEAARNARGEFERVFSKGELPEDIPEFDGRVYDGPTWIVKILTDSKMAKSGGEARRLIRGGGVSIDGEKVPDENYELELRDGMLLKVGKRRFLKIRC
jgi:tyrosyl-tRNA synthetase